MRSSLIAAALCLIACQAEKPQESEQAKNTSEVVPLLPARKDVPAATPVTTSPLPAPAASDDEFVGWFVEQGGVGRLQACGQSGQLQVANPAFLRELKGKLGSGAKPVYVRLRLRVAPGLQLEVTEVQQFGSDETPIENCILTPVGG